MMMNVDDNADSNVDDDNVNDCNENEERQC